jgi:hypothetical protein
MSEKELMQIEEKIKSELEPFLDFVRKKPASWKMFGDAYVKYRKKTRKSQELLNTLVPEQWVFAPKKDLNEKETAYLTFVYLGLVESFGNCIAEIVSMLIIANGNEFHIERKRGVPRIKHVTSIDDFEKETISLGVKLAFLEDNNVKKLPSIINSKLRNLIAHFNFEIRKDGIYVKGQPAIPLIWGNLAKLTQAIRTTNSLLEELVKSRGILQRKVLSDE